MKRILCCITILLLFGCATCYEQKLERLQYLNCWDSAFIGYLSSQIPKDEFDKLSAQFRERIRTSNIFCGSYEQRTK
jgi:hypothetical protein